MAQTKEDQFITLKITDMKNCELINQLNVWKKTIFNVEKVSREPNKFTKSNSRKNQFVSGESLKQSRRFWIAH